MTISASLELFTFFVDLAYKSRIALPILIFCGFLAFDVSMQMELTMQSERVANNAHQPLVEFEENDADSDELSLASSDDDIVSHTDSEASEFMRTVLCLEVEIDSFRNTNAA